MIEVSDLSLQQGAYELRNISFSVPTGAYAVMMGPSGCGKTTLIEVICGLRTIESGEIILDDRDVTGLQPAEREIAYVPQDRALFPGYLVREQIAFSLVLRKWSQSEIHHRVNELAALLNINALLERLPDDLSGGEKQRVSLARALAANPRVLCLDEPLSALDEDMHEGVCELLKKIHEKTGVTVCHITHSSKEAQRLATHIFRMDAPVAGKSAQLTKGTFVDGVWTPSDKN